MELTGSHVLVTGASRGIGRALVNGFAARGARLTLVARSADVLDELAAEVGGQAVPADLADPAQVQGLVGRAEASAGQPVDVLVANAGIDATGRYAEMPADLLRTLLEVNVAAPAELARQALPGMVHRANGRVVFISSLSAEVALPGLTAYSATKAAVSQLADGLRSELRGTGVGTTLVEIGSVTGTGLYDAAHRRGETARAFDRVRRLRVLRDLTTDEVARAVLDAVAHDRPTVVLPRRARLQWAMSRASQRVSDVLVKGA